MFREKRKETTESVQYVQPEFKIQYYLRHFHTGVVVASQDSAKIEIFCDKH